MATMTSPLAPVNGTPSTLAEFVDDEARAYREQGTAEAAFLADQLDRIAQLIRWTGARTPEEYTDRLEAWEETIREGAYERGYREGSGSQKNFQAWA